MKRSLKVLGFVLFAVLGFISIVPAILSTNVVGKPIVTFALKQFAPFQECTYDSLSIGWWSSFQIKGFQATLSTPDHSKISVKECVLDKSLLNLLMDQNNLGTIQVIDPACTHTIDQVFGGIKPFKANVNAQPNSKLPYLNEIVPETALQGHIIVKNASLEVKDGKGQLVFFSQSPHTECQGAFDLSGPLAISSNTLFWDGLEGTKGTLKAACQLRKDYSVDGDFDCTMPSISLKLVEALLKSFGVVQNNNAKLIELLGGKAFLHASLKENVGFISLGVPICTTTAHFKLQGTTINVEPGTLFKATCTPELYSQLLSLYDSSIPYRLLKPLQLTCALPTNCTFNWSTLTASNLLLHFSSPDTLWTSGKNGFYTNLDIETEYDSPKIQAHAVLTVKKEPESQEFSKIIFDCAVPSLTAHSIPFSVHTGMDGGFIASLVPAPYDRYMKAIMEPNFNYTASANGSVTESNALNIEGEFVMNSSLGKKQAKFNVDQKAIQITGATAELEINLHDLWLDATGSLCTVKAQLNDLYIPLQTTYAELLNKLTMSGTVSMTLPSLEYKGQKVLDSFSLSGSVQKKLNDDSVSVEIDQTSNTSLSSTPILAFIPTKSHLHASYHIQSGALVCSSALSSSAADFEGSLSGSIDYNNMKFQAKDAWKANVVIKQPDALRAFMPVTFQNCSIVVSPFKATAAKGSLIFTQNPEIQVDLLGIKIGTCTPLDTHSVIKFSALKNEWNGQLKIVDTNKNKLVAAEFLMKQSGLTEVRADILPSILPFVQATQLAQFSGLYDGLKTAHFDCTVQDIYEPGKSAKAHITYLSDRVELESQLQVKNNTLSIVNEGKNNLLKVTVDAKIAEVLKKNGYMTQSVELLAPIVITIPSCSLKSHFDAEKQTITSLDGDVGIRLDEIRLKVQDKKCILNPMDLAFHIEDSKKAICTLKSTAPLTFETRTSISGDCTATYKEPLQSLSLDKMLLKGSLSLQDIPSELVHVFCPKAEVLSEALAPTFSLTSTFTSDKLSSGEAQFHLRSPQLTCDLDSSLIKNGSLTLTSPLKVSLKIDKKRSQALFKKLSSFVCSSIEENEHEIRLTIAPQGSSIPLSNFSIQAITLPSITLDIGKVDVKSSGVLKSLIHILHPKTSKTVTLWTTKVHSSLLQGVYTLERVDCMVADLIHLFVWGTIDLAQKNIDMKVAIPPDTFKNMRLYISLPRPVTMSIHGSLDSPSVDTARLTARLAGAGASTYGAATGALEILGSALQIASTVGEDTTDIPPPVESPFPWEK